MSKQKIAVLGGGLGSLSAAYWLTESEGAADKYDITVYQQGWRLGGKGASGRSMKPGQGKRIEEHGLHIWFGFYENAFRTLRNVLDALDRETDKPATYSDLSDAFRPHSLVVLGDNGPDGLEQWPILFPRNDRAPGRGEHPGDWGMFVEALQLGLNFFEGRFGDENELEELLEGFALPDWATRLFWRGERLMRTQFLRMVHRTAKMLPTDPLLRHPQFEQQLANFLQTFRDTVRGFLKRKVPKDIRARRVYRMTDLLATTGIGILRDQLLKKGFESVDHLEFREWLRRHGADADETLGCNFTRVINDLMFGYQGGEESGANIAAGTAAHILLLVVSGYDGAFMYKMQSGMGDAIFVPLYGLLKARGVKFEFFHRVDHLEPGSDGHIERIDMTRQVKLKASSKSGGGYQPLLRVGAFDTWPAEPLYDQIENGDALKEDPNHPGRPYNLESAWSGWNNVGKRSLKRGKDFDLVINGIPIEVQKTISKSLVQRSRDWQRALHGADRVRTVRTQAFQVWWTRTPAEMGWEVPERMRDAAAQGLAAPLLGGYFQPFNTWCDMSQVLPEEDWSGGPEPRSISYFCGQMPDDPDQPGHDDHGYPERERQKVLKTATDWIRNAGPVLWPTLTDPYSPTSLDPKSMLAADGAPAFEMQYFRANIDDAERYTLSVAGSTASRLPPHDPAFPNLYLAGDWVRNPVLNAGCVEATVASGMAASRAICGYPRKIEGEFKPVAKP